MSTPTDSTTPTPIKQNINELKLQHKSTIKYHPSLSQPFQQKQNLIENVKTELNKGKNCFDYFLIMGVDPSICFLNDLYTMDIKDINTLYKDELQPKILSKFPHFDKSYVNIDNGILNHCFQKNCLLKEFTTPPKPHTLNFILDNCFFSINHPQKYVTCLIFYEHISKYKNLSNIINTNINKHSCQLESYYDEYSTKLKLNEDDTQTKGSTKRSKSVNNKSKCKYHNYYITKCICLISVIQLFEVQKNILLMIYEYSLNDNIVIPIEKIIENLIVEVPLPPRGLFEIEYQLQDKKVKISQNKMNELPSNENEIKFIFKFFPNSKDITEILKHLLYETKTILFSSNPMLLTPFIYGMLSMLFPFRYSFQVVSCIPANSYQYLESISPYILGINTKYSEDFFTQAKIDISDSSILIIDLDNKKIDLKSDEEFPELPAKFKVQLVKLINEYINNMNNNVENEESLQKMFFYFHVNIMQTYKLFLNDNYYKSHQKLQSANINTLFQVKKFIESFPESDKKFYQKFVTETQIFSDFIFKRMIPKDTKDKLEILFFDEHIMQKKNYKIYSKEQQEIFLSSTEYDISGSYFSPKPKELNKNEQLLFSYASSTFHQLFNAQLVKKVNKGNQIRFSYPIFPVLNDELLFLSSEDYIFPPNLEADLDLINNDLVSKSHLSSIDYQNAEMINNIYLSWLALWSTSFWYNDIAEREFRFKQMITVLDKVIHHDMEILNILFETLNSFSEEQMMMTLYEKLIGYRLNPSAYIYSIVNKIMGKKEGEVMKVTDAKPKTNQEEKIDMITEYKKENFRKRTFKNKFEPNVVGDEVKFYCGPKCVECNEQINLVELCKNFDNMKKDICWAECSKCQNNILPKISVRVGYELNENMHCKNNTSTFDDVVLYSPYNLKIGLNEGILNQSNKRLDIDNFRYKFSALFWNCIWYFFLNRLDYSFILPYEDNVQKVALKANLEIVSRQKARVHKIEHNMKNSN